MSEEQPSTVPGDRAATDWSAEVPLEYVSTYERAYRASLAAHATEFIAPARPGKRAAQAHGVAAWRQRAEELIVGILAHRTRRRVAATVAVLALLLIAYGLGRAVG